MQYFFLALAFFFGAAIGSFVAVIAGRYNTGLPFFKGRSICFSCGAKLSKRDLVPIFSYIFLKGRCRHCGSKIPGEAFAIEIIMGILSVSAFIKSGLWNLEFSALNYEHAVSYLATTAVIAAILLLSVYDMKHFIIPDSFLAAFCLFSIIYLLHSFDGKLLALGFSRVIAALALALPLFLLYVISKGKWLGFGDVKYVLAIGIFLGFIQGLSAVILAFWIGAAFSLLALSLKFFKSHIGLPPFAEHLTIKSEIPFGPFLSMGTLLSFYFNADIFQIHSFIAYL